MENSEIREEMLNTYLPWKVGRRGVRGLWNKFKIRYLRGMDEVTLTVMISNDYVQAKTEMVKKSANRVDSKVRWCFEHMVRMDVGIESVGIKVSRRGPRCSLMYE